MVQLLKLPAVPGVRAMPGICPIPLPRTLGLPVTDLELLDWYFAVLLHALGKGHIVTKDGVIGWLGSLVEDCDDLAGLRQTLRWMAPDTDEPPRLIPIVPA